MSCHCRSDIFGFSKKRCKNRVCFLVQIDEGFRSVLLLHCGPLFKTSLYLTPADRTRHTDCELLKQDIASKIFAFIKSSFCSCYYNTWSSGWGHDPVKVWKKVLTVPDILGNTREALVLYQQVTQPSGWFFSSLFLPFTSVCVAICLLAKFLLNHWDNFFHETLISKWTHVADEWCFLCFKL